MVAVLRRMDIVIPLFNHFEPLDALGPYEILAYVPGATMRFVAAEPGLVQDVLGSLPVHVPTRYSEVERCDVLLIPGGGSFRTMVDDPGFLGWVRRIHAGTRFTTSVCTGSLVLGAAGLLDGLTATTHWDAAAELESYGAVCASAGKPVQRSSVGRCRMSLEMRTEAGRPGAYRMTVIAALPWLRPRQRHCGAYMASRTSQAIRKLWVTTSSCRSSSPSTGPVNTSSA